VAAVLLETTLDRNRGPPFDPLYILIRFNDSKRSSHRPGLSATRAAKARGSHNHVVRQILRDVRELEIGALALHGRPQ
jgi:hypothetical protein